MIAAMLYSIFTFIIGVVIGDMTAKKSERW